MDYRVELAKRFMFNQFTPALHDLLQSADPHKYRQWGGNMCRQSAIFGAKILEEILPEYEWEVWDGMFSDQFRGEFVKYNHAWIYGKNKEKGKGLLVDLSRRHHERLFIETTQNKYPKNTPDYRHMKLISKEKLDYNHMIEREQEYYTGWYGTKVLSHLIKKLT
jgi:hypothetical protein